MYMGLRMASLTKIIKISAYICVIWVYANTALAQTNSLRLAPGFTKLPANAKVVVMPLDVELFSLSAGGVLEPQAAWSQQANGFLTLALEKRTGKSGQAFQMIKESNDEAIDDLNHLHSAVATSIAIHHAGPIRLPTKEGKLDWSLGTEIGAIRKTTNAQYALFTFVRDSYATAERKAAMVAFALLGVGIAGGAQTGYASLVDLNDGRVVWFNKVARGFGDLREQTAAEDTLKALLTDFPE
jgi:hypothetical protein